ncbi:MAG: hypothetical protein Q9225_006721 [Loekoesia sp. 1 TL-2023]
MPVAMELRKNIKAPRRYEDELDEEAARPSPVRAAPANVIRQNPNLPPAAFPTLDLRQPSARENRQADNHIPTNYRKNAHDPANSSSREPNRRSTTTEPHSPQLQHLPMASTSQVTGPHMDNGPGNPIWEMNMRLLEKLDKRTDEDWFMAEMETSDEDGAPSQPKAKNASQTENIPPIRETIPLALRIEMVYAAAGEDSKAEHALARLKLNANQREVMMEELRQYQAREKEEDARIAAHQSRLHNALLRGPRARIKEDPFQQLYENDREDVVVSRRAVNEARAYMASCALDDSFLDSWSSMGNVPTATVTESGDEIDARYPNAVSMRDVLAADGTATPTLPDRTKTSVKEPSNGQVALPSPPEHSVNGQIAVDPSNQVLPPTTTKRQVTGETIEVNVGGPQAFLGGNDPQTPQQQPSLEQTLVKKFVEWPYTPPSPTLGTFRLPESSGSDYEPKPKKQRTNTARKKPVSSVNASPARETGFAAKVDRTARRKPVTSTDTVDRDGEKGEVTDQEYRPLSVTQGVPQAEDNAALGEMESSSAPTEQENSTIVVHVPEQQPTPAAHQAGENGASAANDTGGKPKKRGRPKKSKG